MLREERDVHETVHGGVHREEEELSGPYQDYVISNIMIKLKSRESEPGTQSNDRPRRRSHGFITVTCDRRAKADHGYGHRTGQDQERPGDLGWRTGHPEVGWMSLELGQLWRGKDLGVEPVSGRALQWDLGLTQERQSRENQLERAAEE